MAKPKRRRKSDAARWANQVVRNRTAIMMGLLGVAAFGALLFKLYNIQINQHDTLQEQAVAQQTRSTVVTASREQSTIKTAMCWQFPPRRRRFSSLRWRLPTTRIPRTGSILPKALPGF